MMALFQNLFGPPQPPGMQPAAPALPRVPWSQNPAITTAALSLLGGRNLNEGLANVAATAGQGMAAKSGLQAFMLAQQEKQAAKSEADARKAQMNDVLKAWPGLTEQQRALFSAQPELFGQYAVDSMGAKAGGTFAGTGLDAQDSNILLSGDPSSPEYAMAFSRQYETPKMVTGTNEQGQMIVTPVMPPIPPGIRRPTGGTVPAPPGASQQQAPAPTDAAAATGGARVGDPIVTGTAKPSDTQMNAALYADRMTKSNEVITSLERAGTSYVDQAASQVPLGIGNYLISDDYRQLDQAQRDFINATLRRESGAVISPEEFDNARKQYFPQPGDDPKTIEQKRANRETAITGISRAAGPSYKSPGQGTGGAVDWREYFK